MEEKVIFLNPDGSPDKDSEFKAMAKDVAATAIKYGAVGLKEGWKFFSENKEDVAAFLGVVATTAGIIKQLREGREKRTEDKFNKRKSARQYRRYSVKRPLTEYEAHVYKRRLENGEESHDILKSMGLLR